jgi:hypothetical protein
MGGVKPPWTAKEGNLLKADLARLGFDRLRALVGVFFDSPPRAVADFAAGAGWTYTIFHSQLPRLEAAVAGQKARLSLVRICPHCGKEQEHTGADCLYCYKPLNAKVAANG